MNHFSHTRNNFSRSIINIIITILGAYIIYHTFTHITSSIKCGVFAFSNNDADISTPADNDIIEQHCNNNDLSLFFEYPKNIIDRYCYIFKVCSIAKNNSRDCYCLNQLYASLNDIFENRGRDQYSITEVNKMLDMKRVVHAILHNIRCNTDFNNGNNKNNYDDTNGVYLSNRFGYNYFIQTFNAKDGYFIKFANYVNYTGVYYIIINDLNNVMRYIMTRENWNMLDKITLDKNMNILIMNTEYDNILIQYEIVDYIRGVDSADLMSDIWKITIEVWKVLVIMWKVSIVIAFIALFACLRIKRREFDSGMLSNRDIFVLWALTGYIILALIIFLGEVIINTSH